MAKGRKTKVVELERRPSQADEPTLNGSPLVFISHDTRDAALAEEFALLLTDVSAGTLHSFRSSDKKGTSGIEFGEEWYQTVMSRIYQATDVVALLTPRSLERPWILYETGVAKGKKNTTALGLAIGLPLSKASTGPFGQFQNCGDDIDSLTKLVLQLLARVPNSKPREEAIRARVKTFKDAVAAIQPTVAVVPANQSNVDATEIAKMFEEVKLLVKQLPIRVARLSTKEKRDSSYVSPIEFRRQVIESPFFEDSANSIRDSVWGLVLANRHPLVFEKLASTLCDAHYTNNIAAGEMFRDAVLRRHADIDRRGSKPPRIAEIADAFRKFKRRGAVPAQGVLPLDEPENAET